MRVPPARPSTLAYTSCSKRACDNASAAVIPFCIVLGFSIGTTGFALRILLPDEDGFTSALDAGLTTYNLMMLGDFEPDTYRKCSLHV